MLTDRATVFIYEPLLLLVFSKYLCSLFKVFNDGFFQWIPILHDDCGIDTLTFYRMLTPSGSFSIKPTP